jgi:hypothetical protein
MSCHFFCESRLGLSTSILHECGATSTAILSVKLASTVLCCATNHKSRNNNRVRTPDPCFPVPRCDDDRVLLRTSHRSLASTAAPSGMPMSSQCAVIVAASAAVGDAYVVPVRGDRGRVRRVPVQHHHRRPVSRQRRRPDLVAPFHPHLLPPWTGGPSVRQ